MSFQQRWPPAPGTGSSGDSRSAYGDGSSTSPVFEALADATRRHVLGVLLERDGPTDTATLASELAERSRADGSRLSDDDSDADSRGDADAHDDDRRDLRVELRHVHLPALAAIPLVSWDRQHSTVALAEHPALEDDTLRAVVTSGADAGDVFEALADERRRLLLAVLDAYGGPIDVGTVLEKVADLEGGDAGRPPEQLADLRVAAAHVHLPKLDDAGLVRRDPERETVEYVGHPDVEERWFRL